MTERSITICGRQVHVAYCYATEIAFHAYTGRSVSEFITESAAAAKEGRTPDPQGQVHLILSAIMAYSEARNEEPAVRDRDIIYDASPSEIGSAVGDIVRMYAEWYALPKGEPEDMQTEGDSPKNA